MDGTIRFGRSAADGFAAGSPGSQGQHPPGRSHTQPGPGGHGIGYAPFLYLPGDGKPADHRLESQSRSDRDGPAAGPPDPESVPGTSGEKQPSGGCFPEKRSGL